MTKNSAQKLRNNLIFFDTIICLSACWASASESLKELFEWDEDRDMLKAAGFTNKEIKRLLKKWDDDYIALILEEGEMTGYFVKAVIPAPEDTRVEKDIVTHGTYSWGHTQWQWFYVQTIEEAVEKAIEWKHKQCLESHVENKRD
jgi:hypothetical protein